MFLDFKILPGLIGSSPNSSVAIGQTSPTGIATNTEQLELDESKSINFAEYYTYRKLFLPEPNPDLDIMPVLDDPVEMQQRIKSSGAGKAANIESLINRQAPIEQSLAELISNSTDASVDIGKAIGQFGMGALQLLAFVIDENNAAGVNGAHVIVETATADGQARRIVFFKGKNNELYFTSQRILKANAGTTVRLKLPKGLKPFKLTAQQLKDYVAEKMDLSTKLQLFLNGQLLNPLDNHIYLNGDIVRYDHPEKRVDINISDNEIVIADSGRGMSDKVIFNKYLLPRLGVNNPVRKQLTEAEIQKEVHIFYKASTDNQKGLGSRVAFQVSGVTVQSMNIPGHHLPSELVIQLPSNTRQPLSRNSFEIDDSTHIAFQELAVKIVKRQPIHQFHLINGLSEAARYLDAENLRYGAQPYLIDTTRDVFTDFIAHENRLMLPTDPVFEELDVRQDTLFVDQSLLYGLSPDQIPGSCDITKFFSPGTLKRAYTVPFKADSKKSYITLGNNLLVNERIYNKHKRFPLLLNLRLNFYVGYGKRKPDKGWFKAYVEQEQKTKLTESSSEEGVLWEDYPNLLDTIDLTTQYNLQLVMKHLELTTQQKSQFMMSLDRFAGSIPKVFRSTELISNLLLDLGFNHKYFDCLGLKVPLSLDINTCFTNTSSHLSSGINELVSDYRHLIPQGNISHSETSLSPQIKPMLVDIPFDNKSKKAISTIWSTENKPDSFLELFTSPQQLNQPSNDFLIKHAAFFQNPEHPERLQVYLYNLINGKQVLTYKEHTGFHSTMSQLNPMALPYLDAEILDNVAELQKKNNLERLAECFKTINTSLSHIIKEEATEQTPDTPDPRLQTHIKGGEAQVKRLILRWIRIYKNNPHATERFHELLSKEYEVTVEVMGDGAQGGLTEGKVTGDVNKGTEQSWFELDVSKLPKLAEEYVVPGGYEFKLFTSGLLILYSVAELEFRIINSNTGKEFQIVIPRKLRRAIEESVKKGLPQPEFSGFYLKNNLKKPCFVMQFDEETVLFFILDIDVDKVHKLAMYGQKPLINPDSIKNSFTGKHDDSGNPLFLFETFGLADNQIVVVNFEEYSADTWRNFRSNLQITSEVDGAGNPIIIERVSTPQIPKGFEIHSQALGNAAHSKKVPAIIHEEFIEIFSINGQQYFTAREENTIKLFRLNIDAEDISMVCKLPCSNLEHTPYTDENGNPIFIMQNNGVLVDLDDAIPVTSIVEELNKSLSANNDSGINIINPNPIILKKILSGGSGNISSQKSIEKRSLISIDLETGRHNVIVSENGDGINKYLPIYCKNKYPIHINVNSGSKKIKLEELNLKDGLMQTVTSIMYTEYYGEVKDVIYNEETGQILIEYTYAKVDGRRPSLQTRVSIINLRNAITRRDGEQVKAITGFASLAEAELPEGLPSLTRNLIQFLRDENVAFVDNGVSIPRDDSWNVSHELVETENPFSLARLNYLFEKHAQIIIKNPRITSEEFSDLIQQVQSADVTAYEQIVQSCIVGQSHAWLREIGIQNPRDAIRKAREQWLLGMDEGKLQHRNYIENGNWIYSMSDPVGMDMWTLIRFYFPIDQSSKDYLADTGNLGQGNYTLYPQ